MPRRLREVGLTVALGTMACSEPLVEETLPRPIPTSSLQPGLALRDGELGSNDGHLVELLVHDGHVYAANSNWGVTVMRLADDGSLQLTAIEGEEALHRCTTLAVHGPSNTLYCGSDQPFGSEPGARIEIYDISTIPTSGEVVWKDRMFVEPWGVRDLEVGSSPAGESRLFVAHFDDGLWTATIDAQGGLSQLEQTPVPGNVHFVVELGERLVGLLAEPQGTGAALVLLDPHSFAALDRLELHGPPLGLTADADGAAKLAVALGSGGMAIVAVEADTLVLERVLEPPAVVTWGVLAGELAVAVTLTGAFAWELEGDQARMFGFGVAGQLGHRRAGNMLHGVLHEGELLTSDWLGIERWSIDPGGEVLDLDVPRGIYLPPNGPVRWRMRNPGGRSLRAELWHERDRLWSGGVGPGELVDVALTAEQRAAILPADEPTVPLIVRVYDPEVPSIGEPLTSTVLVLAQRRPDDLIPPAVGDPFPSVTFEDSEFQPFTLPPDSQTIWYAPDCALMWPEIEDLAWLQREGRDLGRGEPIFLTEFDVRIDGFPDRFALDGARFGIYGPSAPSLADANPGFGEDLYAPFFIEELPGDAMPTDYVIDPQGTVASIERMYRGPWTLVVAGPWE